jgi:cytochrome c biogenesis factor
MQVHVNFLAVAAATVASYILGAIWYGAIFSKLWVKLTGVTDMKPAPLNIILVLLASFLMAYVLDHSIIFGDYYLKASGITGGLEGAFFLWLGFVATVTLCTKLYEKKPWGLWLLDNGFWLIAMMVMATILSVWP